MAGLRACSEAMMWGVRTFSKPPNETILKLSATGAKSGRERKLKAMLSHDDGYVLTAVPVVACLKQYLDGSIRKPGLFTQANIAEPNRMIEDMKSMGVRWEVRWEE